MAFANKKSAQQLLALTALAIYAGGILQYVLQTYSSYFRFIFLSFTESYLIVCYFTAYLSIFHILSRIGVSSRIRVSRILLFIVLSLLALIFYQMGYSNEQYLLQYDGISFILFVFAMIALIFDFKNIVQMIAVLLILLCTVPIPPSISGVFLSFFISITKFSTLNLLLLSPGLSLIGSVLSVTPIVIAVMYNEKISYRNILRITALLIMATVIGFAGDLIRTVLYIQNVEMGILGKMLSSTLIYSLVSVLLVLIINRKIIKFSYLGEKIEEKDNLLSFILSIVIVFASLISLIIITQTFLINSPLNSGIEVRLSGEEQFMNNSTAIIFEKIGIITVNEYSYIYNDGIEDAILSEFSAGNGSNVYKGILSLSRTPNKLYDAKTILELENYIIKQEWSNQDNYGRVYYYIVEGSGEEKLVLQRLIKTKLIYNDSSNMEFYGEITLMANLDNNTWNFFNSFNNALNNLGNSELFPQFFDKFKTLVTLLYVFIFLLLSYLSIDPLRKAIRHILER